MYPTAAKLTGAVSLAALAWLVSGIVRHDLPPAMPSGMLAPVNAAVGFVAGWRVVGPGAGRGYGAAIGAAATGGAVTLIVCLLIWASHTALGRSLDGFYDGPVEAIEAAMGLAADHARVLWPGAAIPVLLGGCAIVGLVVEWVSRRAN
ncbi:tellurite resistance protein [Oceaniovalibus guishaninsula JLT2003]|uniref:Tellurite resistance protein n=1 Tax=Oceaniovalibus guishaninsula JLT2003 TaxID=1231392 RepID=K2H905_9RHOB|nr:TrgA family protein [Oceaniovalibus guishaninsula]EKE44058.1 tellurite resistance protein [Oceaniovalibus guishaninsula JLT2003]